MKQKLYPAQAPLTISRLGSMTWILDPAQNYIAEMCHVDDHHNDQYECDPDNREETARLLVERYNEHEALIDLLCDCLPYIEDWLDHKDFKPGVIKKLTDRIKNAITRGESK